ncbi:MAG: MFS transporter [Hyphomicrobiales bacterium]|nr:MFS transporter [Hyphomicrobiales bacterium]
MSVMRKQEAAREHSQVAQQTHATYASVLWCSCLAMLAVGANGTAIMAALPSMAGELSLTQAGVEWAVNAYLVVSAATIVLGGQAADRFGAPQASIVGLAVFTLASCIIGFANTPSVLLAGRALQGLGAALAVPSTLAAVGTGATLEKRTAAMAAWTGFLMLGFSIGPLVGGALTHFIGWRVIFWANAIVMSGAIAGMALGLLRGGKVLSPSRRLDRPTDWPGFILLAIFMVALVFALHALPHMNTAPLSALGPFALAVGAFSLLSKVEGRVVAPLVDRSLFLSRGFAMGVGIGSLSMFSILSLLLYFNLYAQSREGLGFTALQAGASLLPLSAALLVLSLSASAVAKKIGVRTAITGGMALVVIASATTGVAVAGGSMVVLAAGLFLMGAGLALPYGLAPRLALASIAPGQAGQGSGIVNACTFLGGSAGIAAGAAAFAVGGFLAVLGMIALAGMTGAMLGRGMVATA